MAALLIKIRLSHVRDERPRREDDFKAGDLLSKAQTEGKLLYAANRTNGFSGQMGSYT
jgi:hypothetical protein